jgi:leader peptidase (prepilin peptidase)/N-methyltransferase
MLSASSEAALAPETAADAGVAEADKTLLVGRSDTLRAPAAVLALPVGALAFTSYPLGAGAIIAAFVAVILVVLAAIDIERRIIPNRIVLPAAAIVVAARVAEYPHRGLEFLVAPLAAALFLLLPNLLRGSAIGMGDVKLGLLLGAALGWGVVDALLVAFLCAAPVSAAILIRGGASARKTKIPLGPFLAVGALVILIVPRL